MIVGVLTVFLSGGTGFVGGHVARLFLAAGWRVRALVRRPERPGLLPAEAEIVRGDLVDADGYRDHLKGCDVVVHGAAVTRARSLAEFRRVNVAGTEAIVDAARASCPDAMFVHVSSQAAAGPARAGVPVREADPPAPVSWYGRSKLESEQAVAGSHHGPWCVVRPSVVYGAGDSGLLTMFALVGRGVAPIVGGGRRRVQLLAVEDLARVLFVAAQRPDLHGRRGFAAGDTVSMGELVREIAALRSPRARTIAVPDAAIRLLGRMTSLRDRVTGSVSALNRDKVSEMLQADWLCDAEPFLRDLQITPAVYWRDGIRRVCRWYADARWLPTGAFAGA